VWLSNQGGCRSFDERSLAAHFWAMTKYRETDPVKRLKPDSFFEQLVADGSPFASGTSREVFSVADDPAVVIKRAKNPYPGANMAEWFIWNAVRSTDLADAFAEVLSLSESGRFLMMLRLTPLTQAVERLRKGTPRFPCHSIESMRKSENRRGPDRRRLGPRRRDNFRCKSNTITGRVAGPRFDADAHRHPHRSRTVPSNSSGGRRIMRPGNRPVGAPSRWITWPLTKVGFPQSPRQKCR
jgi:hypothetical protein